MAPSMQVRSQQPSHGLANNNLASQNSSQTIDSITPNTAARRSWSLLEQCKRWLAATPTRIQSLLGAPKLEVWTTKDAEGHIFWHAYDPDNRQGASGLSESEMRVWLEDHQRSARVSDARFGMSVGDSGYRRDSRVL